MTRMITAAEMAHSRGIDSKIFRAALRRARLPWHDRNAAWTVVVGSPEHADLERVLASVSRVPARRTGPVPARKAEQTGAGRREKDEQWIISLCDSVLGLRAIRQHRFPFLLGDPGFSGRRVALSVDAFYPDLDLVIEYHERQHSEEVPFFDRKIKASGMTRGKQRRHYDDLRRTLLCGPA